MKIRKDNTVLPVEFRSLKIGKPFMFGDDALYVKVSGGYPYNATLMGCGTLVTFGDLQGVWPVQIIQAVVRDAKPF